MSDNPERHHTDCDYRNSMAARETEEIFGLPERTDVFGCTCDAGSDYAPGPWSVRSDRYGITVDAGVDDPFAICEMAGIGAHAESDARLIAAAPDLLAACQERIANSIAGPYTRDPDTGELCYPGLARMADAVNKATGA
jgi:hypothetical protein